MAPPDGRARRILVRDLRSFGAGLSLYDRWGLGFYSKERSDLARCQDGLGIKKIYECLSSPLGSRLPPGVEWALQAPWQAF